MSADPEPAASKTVPAPPGIEPGALSKSDPQTFLDWEGDLCDEANRHYVQYCQTCTLATTVLLGFIFDAAYKNTNPPSVLSSTHVALPMLIRTGWFLALASLACGLAYLLRAADALFETARKSRAIANAETAGHPEEARTLYYEMLALLEGNTRHRRAEGGPYRPGHIWLVLQTCFLGAALFLVSLHLFCR